ncbi:hypothetical protein HBI56_186370 [Parastagonospora nodorum]|nr:hypothetical protein HBH53_113300 [Parastagonospora nodorum]KAH4194526.1 hypothetical protein HBI95_199070 [Parastagonospora nodorum]KAH4218365.1 hypothetical protein HBI06_201770 [Parastagonospora nodorum]KAH4231259.1 hypothetical protein HBI05_182190 [Parastagonospora nodorum]KAH4340441.1 hypothetical protein HBH98_191450 [Parastagonospora nodorum]
MVKLFIPILCAITGTQALWLAVSNQKWENYANQGGVFPTRYCVVGRGENEQQAIANSKKRDLKAISVGGAGYCDQLPYSKSNQGGGYWNDHGTINYIDDNWHWYCNPLKGETGAFYWDGACDAGSGAPRKKREVEFAA